MENEKIITLQLQLTRRKALFLISFFFLCWRPGFLGSETMTLTTYYPAPYGGYASILTTGQTLLARDTGNVGIGTGASGVNYVPSQKLEVQGGNITATGDIMGNYTSATKSGSGMISFQAGEGAYLALVGSNQTRTDLENLNGTVRLLYRGSPSGGTPPSYLLKTDIFDVNPTGDVRIQGTLTNLCVAVSYGPGVTLCPTMAGISTRVVAFYGDGVPRVSGVLSPSGPNMGTIVAFGEDWNGTMLCCKIQ